jgi:hypothetical protein
MILYMISWFFPWYCMISYNIISILAFLALFSWHIIYDIIYILYEICCDIRITWYWAWFWPWFGPLISVLRDIIAIWCHIWYYSLYHGTCAAGWRGLGAPCARCSTSSCLAVANVLGTCVQLNGDGLDPAHGLVAKAAARVVHRGRFVVVEKRRLAAAVAAGCAAHAGKAPMDSSRWHRGFKYGLGVQYGFKFKLETGDEV